MESMQDPIQGLDLTCMTINMNLSKACFEHNGYIYSSNKIFYY